MLDKYISIDEKAKEDLKPKEEQSDISEKVVITNEAMALSEAIKELTMEIRKARFN
jgi:hypothetical protein